MGLHRQAILVVFICTVLAVCQGCARLHEASASPTPAYAPSEGEHTLGNRNAPVVFVQYDSPTCPHCAAVLADSFPHIKTDYIDSGKIFYVYRVFPLNRLDAQVQSVALCLPESKYFPFMASVLSHQDEWDPRMTTKDAREGLAMLARDAGLGDKEFDRCFTDAAVLDRIERDGRAVGADLKINGAPSFVINGNVSQGNEGWSALRERIEVALKSK
jgi:protein-disulfide isomerase